MEKWKLVIFMIRLFKKNKIFFSYIFIFFLKGMEKENKLGLMVWSIMEIGKMVYSNKNK
jgi:hypothetical protein